MVTSKTGRLRLLVMIALLTLLASCSATPQGTTPRPGQPTRIATVPPAPPVAAPTGIEEIHLAGGCFWGVEAYLERIDGVVDVVSGYANGTTTNPTYDDVIRGSGHAETVRVRYDTARLSLDELLIAFVRIIDPTSLNRQGPDAGVQYRTGVYWSDEPRSADPHS